MHYFSFLAILANPLAATALVLTIIFSATLFRALTDPLRSVPGPFLARFTRLWELVKVWEGEFEKVNVELHKKYGPVVRLSPNRYSIADPSSIKQIYTHNQGAHQKYVKPKFYQVFADPNNSSMDANIFVDQDNQRHAASRRKVSALYSMTAMLSYEQYVEKCTTMLIEKMEGFAEEGTVVDVPALIQYFAFDVIGEITIGTSFGMLEHNHDHLDILKPMHGIMAYTSVVSLIPEWHTRLGWLSKALKQPNPIQTLLDFTFKQIDHRKAGKTSSDRDDFLTKLLSLHDAGTVQDVDVLNSVFANIAAGSDTTAITISAIIYYLLKNPSCAKKLQSEIDDLAAKGKISNPVTFAQSQEMPYLQAVIKETTRLHPAVGTVLPRTVPASGAMISGHFFPGGTDVGVNAWVINRNLSIYGDDAAVFNPERWLQSSEEQISGMNANLMTFGAGSRTCLGRNIFLLEVGKVLSQLYRRFEVREVDEMRPVECKTENVFFVRQRFECRVTVRK